jgi:hypothetical protein
MNDALRISVAEACNGAREVAQGTRCVTAPSAKLGQADHPGLEAGLLALVACDGGQRNRSRRLHYYIPTYRPRQPPSATLLVQHSPTALQRAISSRP